MNIVIFSDNVAPYRMRWAEELGKTNDVTFAFVKDKDAERNSDWLVKTSEGVTLCKLPAKVIRNHAITRSVARYIKKNKKDIIIFDGYGTIPNLFGMLYCRRHKINYYINIDGIRIGHKESVVAKICKKLVFNKYARLLCGSQYSADYLVSRGIEKNRICVHNFTSLRESELLAILPTLEQKNAVKEKLGFKSLPTLIAVGRFMQLKQFDMVIRAFVPYDGKYQLVIIGEGEERKTYRDLIKLYKLQNVHIVQFMPLEQLKEYYFMADALVLSSNSEVWGMVMNEAMGYGATAIIASNRCVGAYSLIEQGVNGFMFSYDDQKELSTCIDKVLGGGNLIQMQAHSLQIIKDYTVEVMASRHMEFFTLNNDLDKNATVEK